MALIKVGRNKVTDIDSPTTNEEKIINAIFDLIADEVMASGSWTSCQKRASLTSTGTTPSFEYSYEYQLPTSPKCLKVLAVNEEVPGDISYVIEGDKLLTNSSTCKIRYCQRVSNTDSWNQYLSTAFVARLTAELCLILTGSEQKADKFYLKYKDVKDQMLALDNQQGSQQYTSSSDLSDLR